MDLTDTESFYICKAGMNEFWTALQKLMFVKKRKKRSNKEKCCYSRKQMRILFVYQLLREEWKLLFPYIFFSSTIKITWGYTSRKIGEKGNLALAIQCKVIPMWFSPISELLERWLISSSEAEKDKSRNSEAYGCNIAAVKIKIHICTWQFQYHLIVGPHLLLGGGWQWDGAEMRRACATY